MNQERHAWFYLIGFLLLTISILALINLCFVKTDTSRYLMLQELRNYNDNIDVVFVGSSPVYYGINPMVISRETGLTAFDAAIGNMGLPGSVALTELALSKHNVRYVILSLEPDMLLNVQESEEAEARIMPMLPLHIALNYYRAITETDDRFLTRLFYFRTMPVESFKDFIKTVTIRWHTQPYYEEMQAALEETPYMGAGYHEMKLEPQKNGLFSTRAYPPSEEILFEFPFISKKRIEQLSNICIKHGTQLIVTILPLPSATILSSSKQMAVCDELESFCQAKGITFLNAARARETWLQNLDPYYVDIYHVNWKGAEIYSKAISKMIKILDSGNDISDLTYPSWEIYLENTHRIFNTYATAISNENGYSIQAGCICGYSVNPEYQFELEDINGKKKLLQMWSSENRIIINSSEQGTLWVSARDGNNHDTCEICYCLPLANN